MTTLRARRSPLAHFLVLELDDSGHTIREHFVWYDPRTEHWHCDTCLAGHECRHIPCAAALYADEGSVPF
jgi:hypothetical protein